MESTEHRTRDPASYTLFSLTIKQPAQSVDTSNAGYFSFIAPGVMVGRISRSTGRSTLVRNETLGPDSAGAK